jgi:hypothetical protein
MHMQTSIVDAIGTQNHIKFIVGVGFRFQKINTSSLHLAMELSPLPKRVGLLVECNILPHNVYQFWVTVTQQHIVAVRPRGGRQAGKSETRAQLEHPLLAEIPRALGDKPCQHFSRRSKPSPKIPKPQALRCCRTHDADARMSRGRRIKEETLGSDLALVVGSLCAAEEPPRGSARGTSL